MRKRGFDRTEVEVFVALAEAAGVPAAARALGLHHSTVLRVLDSLEQRAGAPLFDRLPGGYRLSEAGRALIEPARALRQTLAGFEQRLVDSGREPAGCVRLTTSDGLAGRLLPQWLAAFARAQPGIEVDVVVSNTVADLRERDIDVALRPTVQPAEHLVGRRAGAMAYSLYASAAYLAARGFDGTLPEQLDGHDLCAYGASLAFFTTARWLAAHATRARVAARFDSLTAMREAARAGLGLAALPCCMVDAADGLVRLMPPPEAMRTELWVLTHPQLRQVPRVRALMAHLADHLAAQAARLDPPA